MDEILRLQYGDAEWPEEAENMYERVEVLGRGSFGVVWMARRVSAPEHELDDEYVALKNIEIKEEKGRIYAQREISILKELRHPNVIRLIRAFPIFQDRCQLVAMQMARGPNLQYLVTKRGALGLPIARLIARHLIAAVSYLHGRAVIHRDIKPTNCILENTELATQDIYDWVGDDMIWSDSAAAEKVAKSGKFKLMVVDFGFARALNNDEIVHQPKHFRNSIVNESARMSVDEVAKLVADDEIQEATRQLRRASVIDGVLPQDVEDYPIDDEADQAAIVKAVSSMGFVPEDEPVEDPPPGDPATTTKRRQSNISMAIPFAEPKPSEATNRTAAPKQVKKQTNRRSRDRQSTTRAKVRSMSALGTKAYAAPEIKHQLRNKTSDDIDRSLEALTECVADYGMIVDAYSVGWTLRVVMTGIPPNVTISQYMRKISSVQDQVGDTGCLCFKTKAPPLHELKVRDTSEIPKDATLLITMLTKTKPEERMTVREAQSHPYIRGGRGDDIFSLPEGDVPSKCGDPVVPLKCAKALAETQKERRKR
jgi:serine/threonine protein kinase